MGPVGITQEEATRGLGNRVLMTIPLPLRQLGPSLCPPARSDAPNSCPMTPGRTSHRTAAPGAGWRRLPPGEGGAIKCSAGTAGRFP
jgi:hypothetical protein